MKWFLFILLAATVVGWVRDRRAFARVRAELHAQITALNDALVYEFGMRGQAAIKRAKWHADSYRAGYDQARLDKQAEELEHAIGGGE